MMIRFITRNVIVPVLPDIAWEYVGDFDALTSWHPGVPPVEMENNADPTGIGSVRTFS
uniref:SRPBCC family protein n=1 Tax=Rhodococcus sp. H36-A4 TaxID=3004353 RepID=UPI002F350101